jgi:hypothetical protein
MMVLGIGKIQPEDNMKNDKPITNLNQVISKLKTLKGAIDYDGDYSTQVVFLLANGETLRFVENDEGEFFIDQYRGLAICGTQENPMTDLGLPAKV